MRFAFFTPEGEITHVLEAPSTSVAELQGGSFIPCPAATSDTTHFVKEGKLQEKQPIPVSARVNQLVLTLSGLPVGVVVGVEGAEVLSDGNDVVIDFDLPGKYEVRLSGHVGYLDQTLEVSLG